MQNTYCEQCGSRAHPGQCQSALSTAETVSRTIKCEVDVAADRFWVCGNNGDDIQVRREADGMIYVGYTLDNRRVIERREVTWDYFSRAFRSFVDGLGDGLEAE